jgi:acetylglutamate synthase
VADAEPADLVLRFLTSIGRPTEARQYLALFRAEHPERFAIIHVADAVVRHAVDALAVEVRYLAELGLRPVVAFGAIEPGGAARAAERLHAALSPGVAAQVVAAPDPAAIRTAIAAGALPLVVLDRADGDVDRRFDALADLAAALGTRRVVFVTRRSGLVPADGRAISIIDLTTEAAGLLAPGALPVEQQKLLRQLGRVIDRVASTGGPTLTISVTSPLDLLRELFTVKGAGTLIRRGSRITRHLTWDTLDLGRLTTVVEEAFGKTLVDDFARRPLLAAYVADDYRGAAIVTPAPLAPYLSKFAVGTVSRGEGVGRDLWRALEADMPRLFWRSRADNPITSWYREQCDGMARIEIADAPWWVLWRGLAPLEIPSAIHYCQAAPPDFAG